MPAVALSRAGARVAESGPGGDDLAAGTWQRLEALPDPRSPQGRIYPLACLIAIAVCAFTAAGNDRLTAVGQQTRRASQQDLARLRAPWDPVAGRYRAPDEKTIRVVLDRLDPQALTRALLGPRARRHRGGLPAASVRSYRSRRAAQETKARARGRLRAVAVDGKTSRGHAAAMVPGCIFSASRSTAGVSWITSRSTSSTTRPAISPHSCSPWTWPVPWSPSMPCTRCGRTWTGWPERSKAITSPS